MTDHATLRTLAAKATPGPWVIDDSDPSDVVIRSAVDQRWVSNIGNWSRQLPMPAALDTDRLRQVYEADAADASYIAALSPDVTLALLDELETLRAALGAVVEALGWAGGSPSFAPEGEARKGWTSVAQPAIERARAALAAGSGR